jgi:hypothetical protein
MGNITVLPIFTAPQPLGHIMGNITVLPIFNHKCSKENKSQRLSNVAKRRRTATEQQCEPAGKCRVKGISETRRNCMMSSAVQNPTEKFGSTSTCKTVVTKEELYSNYSNVSM